MTQVAKQTAAGLKKVTSKKSETLDDNYTHEDYDVFTGNPKLITPPLNAVSKDEAGHDFIWSLKDEPHFSRRKEILKKYPEIQKLFGVEPTTKYVVLAAVLLQLFCAYSFRDIESYKTPLFWVVLYFVGGTVNQAMFLAIHELSHNLGFKSIMANKLFSIMVCNVPIGFPYAASFKPYHMDHHKYQGVVGTDTDLPTELEAKLFSSTLGKLFFATFQIFFYAIRPVVVKQLAINYLLIFNILYIAAVDYAIYHFLGDGSMGVLIYLWASTVMAGSGFHPCAAHFIAEHYVFTGDWETYSYYGILNLFCFNVGYHNEHHDFPNIPGSRLPQLRKIASEYYDNLPYHESWPLVTLKFVFQKNISVWNRVKRKAKGKMEKNIEKEEGTVWQ